MLPRKAFGPARHEAWTVVSATSIGHGCTVRENEARRLPHVVIDGCQTTRPPNTMKAGDNKTSANNVVEKQSTTLRVPLRPINVFPADTFRGGHQLFARPDTFARGGHQLFGRAQRGENLRGVVFKNTGV